MVKCDKMSNDKYLYAFCGEDFDDENTYIYRLDKNNIILKASVNDKSYKYVDPAEVPVVIWSQFAEAAKRKWTTIEYNEQEPVCWSIPENDADTGISFEEFRDIVLERCPGSSYDDDTATFKQKVITPTGYITIDMPRSILKNIAEHNKFITISPWTL